MSDDDTFGFWFGLVAGSLIALIGTTAVFSAKIGGIKRQAIAAGVAEYRIVDQETGETEFIFKKP